MPETTPELICSVSNTRSKKEEKKTNFVLWKRRRHVRSAGTAGVEHLDSVQAGALGNTVGAGTDCTSDVSTVAVAILK